MSQRKGSPVQMTQQEFQEVSRSFLEQVNLTLRDKGEVYSSNDIDRLANFKYSSIPKYIVWRVLFNKHMRVIERYINQPQLQLEGYIPAMQERLIDCVAYLVLLNALLAEEKDDLL